jgi:hypothetical protein
LLDDAGDPSGRLSQGLLDCLGELDGDEPPGWVEVILGVLVDHAK